jgi:Co/Zn/Cd efflux system component
MAGESIQRLMLPLPIQFDQAMIVAVIGLVVNLACATLLHDHHPSGNHDHDAHHGHHDLNRRAAYLHVLADALTSVTAIIALGTGNGLMDLD